MEGRLSGHRTVEGSVQCEERFPLEASPEDFDVCFIGVFQRDAEHLWYKFRKSKSWRGCSTR